MQIIFGNVLKVSVRNTYLRKGLFYYQRAIPRDLRDKYPSSRIKINLETSDPIAAARKVAALDRKHEAEWTLLRADPSSSPQATRLQAERLLAEHGIDPRNPSDELCSDSNPLEHFFSRLDEKRDRYARGDEDRHRYADPSEFLSPVEVAALEIVQNPDKERLSDALKFYLETHHKGESESLQKASNVAMKGLIAAAGDKAIEDFSREDGRAYIKTELARGVSTGTVRRRLNSLVAILNHYFTEKEIDRKNPIAGLKIAGEGEDAEEREPFTSDELKSLQAKCKEADDDPRWLLAMLVDTGARLAEIGGLALDDIKLDDEVPHIVIENRPWRSLKTKDSERLVPLVGMTLWAAKRIKEMATRSQKFAFPRYVKGDQFNTNTASATLAKWLRSNGMDHTPHELRHTMRDRLREVQCPRDIAHAIGGWSFKALGDKASKGDKYGGGYGLKIKREWMDKVVKE